LQDRGIDVEPTNYDLKKLQKDMVEKHTQSKLQEYHTDKTFSRGYGGKYGVEQDKK
jgi:hypothetical protein